MKNISSYLLLLLLLVGCKEDYDSPFVSPNSGFLVVEGVINSGQGRTSIKLSRTAKLENQLLKVQHEKGASVKVEGEDNSSYGLNETSEGNYTANNLNLNNAVKYRLHIRTLTGKEYVSDYAIAQASPPIDSITWKMEEGGVQLYLNTNNILNNTRYYQWDYTETWEVKSQFASMLKFQVFKDRQNRDSFSIAYRDNVNFGIDSSIYKCWQSNESNELLIGSSAQLERDFIYLPIAFVPGGSEKLRLLYSINIRQYGLSKEGYEFLEKIKKNTEQLGSIFDAQPGELKGNIRCITDPSEQVVGFVNICNVSEKRIFISAQDVGGWNFFPVTCSTVSLPNNSDSIRKYMSGLTPTLPSTYATPPTNPPVISSFEAAANVCVDCTVRGTNIKPVFWP